MAATSAPLTQVVTPRTATTTQLDLLVSTLRSVTIKATVAPGTATGYVTFYSGGPAALGVVTKLGRAEVGPGGIATFTREMWGMWVMGQYSGDENHAPSTSDYIFTIQG